MGGDFLLGIFVGEAASDASTGKLCDTLVISKCLGAQASYRKSTSIETLMVWMTATAQPTAQTLTVVCGSDMSPSQQPVTSTMLTMNLRIERDISVQRFAVRFGHFFYIFFYIRIK